MEVKVFLSLTTGWRVFVDLQIALLLELMSKELWGEKCAGLRIKKGSKSFS